MFLLSQNKFKLRIINQNNKHEQKIKEFSFQDEIICPTKRKRENGYKNKKNLARIE